MGIVLEKIRRLRSMSAQEIAYRLRERLTLEGERIHLYLERGRDPEEMCGCLTPPDKPEHFSFKSYLEQGPASRFYFSRSGRDRERLWQMVARHFPQWMEEAEKEAKALCEHKVPLLGYGEIKLGSEIDWHRDPVSGRSWPRRFWADYDLVHESGAGDPKRVHELNRHQHLPRLAKAYFFTGQEHYAREAIAQMESWIEQNPAGRGINWHSSLEIALRVISWLWAIFLLLPSESFDERVARRILFSLVAQVDHIYRYPSRFSSPNTHLIGEATALFLAGLLFSDLEPARDWLQLGNSLLVSEMEKQVSHEGIHAELSSYYHCYTLDCYLQALSLARRNALTSPEWMWKRLSLMLDFLMHMTRSDGSIPLLGDDDGGRALALGRRDYRSFRDALCSGAVLFGREDYKQSAGEFCEQTLWLMGPDAWSTYAALGTTPASRAGAHYPAAGYFIQRSGSGEQESHVVFDCGGLGMLRGGHGHADALSLVLSVGAEEMLIDPGTYLYNSAPEWRNYFRSTRAHNTVVVDEADQSESGDTFGWKKKTDARLVNHLALPDLEFVEAEHDGYTRLSEEVVHRRRLLHARPDYWVVLDDFRGRGQHGFDIYYHFAPDVRVSVREEEPTHRTMTVCGQQAALHLHLFAGEPWKGELLCGETAPIQGWASRQYGEKTAAPVFRARLTTHVPAGAISILLPRPVAHPALRDAKGFSAPCYAVRPLSLDTDKALGCLLERGESQDLVVLSFSDGELEIGDFQMRGDFFWFRSERGLLRRLLAVGARTFRRRGKAVFENHDTLPYISLQFRGDRAAVGEGEKANEFPCAEFAEL